MSWCAKFLVLLSVLACALPSWADDGKSKNGKGKKDSKGKNSKDAEFTVPIPTGHDATGIRLPSYNRDGKLQMSLAIDLARRLDEQHLEMKKVFLETYNADGSPDLKLESESSVLELQTRVVTSISPTTIRRSDFEITGTNLVFDTVLRAGKFTGETRTVIYNLSQSAEPETDKPGTKAEAQPGAKP